MAVAAQAREVVPDGPIVLYDGVCGLCASSVRWILHHERDRDLRFAALQGETAAALRTRYPAIPTTLESVVYIDGGRAHLRSKAFLYMAKHFTRPWRWAHGLRWFPGFILDLGYRVIAAVRYRFWGKVDGCELPSPENRARFLP
ncbi:MAG TPA: DCC1-like thiol-disulfide oxidoreductase family protein [Kofleriaceae bacterium]